MRLWVWINALLRVVVGTYFVLTSLYCLLAFLPYTYTAFIKSPPYPWMPWFARHHDALFFGAATLTVVANWRLRESWAEAKRDTRFLIGLGVLASAGVYLALRPFLPGLQDDRAAYGWSLAALAMLAGLTLWRAPEKKEVDGAEAEKPGYFDYSTGILIAVVVSVLYLLCVRVRIYQQTGSLHLHSVDADLALWSIVSHVALAVVILSALNLIAFVAGKTSRPGMVRRVLVGLAIAASLRTVLMHFLQSAMSFDGWAAQIYAAALATALTLCGFWVGGAFVGRPKAAAVAAKNAWASWTIAAVLCVSVFASRRLIGGEDWNGFVESTWALIFWVGMSWCIYRLRPARTSYSLAVILGTLVLGIVAYKGLQATAIFWGRPMGDTDDEISLKLEEYGGLDASFSLAHHALGNGRSQNCGDLCRILREHTNIRDTHISAGVRLVENLAPTQGERPNIFIFVIDSMRPDYLGAYNPANVHYTPNLDALARDSVVFKNAYTQYAGTSLSEPAIWSGALLLHTHFPAPFSEVNSLQTLARTDGYQTIVSYDTVLRQIFSPSDDLVKLDTDKRLWNQYEACSTVEQLEATLDKRASNAPPVLFYAQPMNVHQFARNDVPSPSSQNWQAPAGMNPRISYEVHWVDSCLGKFFSYLKQRGMYDNSVIVIASDHGDATGELGRSSHSTSIWPEIMRVPLIVHVPVAMREHLTFDDARLAKLTDITPTLYELLGHGPVRKNPLYGRPLFAKTREELDSYASSDIFMASDVRAVYGILADNGRYLYVTYDSPAQSYLFDLSRDPRAEHNIVSADTRKHYDEEIIEHLHGIADYYGYKPGVGSLLASGR